MPIGVTDAAHGRLVCHVLQTEHFFERAGRAFFFFYKFTASFSENTLFQASRARLLTWKCNFCLKLMFWAMLFKLPEWPVPTGSQTTMPNFEWRQQVFRRASNDALSKSFPHRLASGLRGASDDSFF